MKQSNKCTVPLNDTVLILYSFSCSPPETVKMTDITQYHEQIIQKEDFCIAKLTYRQTKQPQ